MAIHEFSMSCLWQAKACSTSTIRVEGRLGTLNTSYYVICETDYQRERGFFLSPLHFLSINDRKTLPSRLVRALTAKQDD